MEHRFQSSFVDLSLRKAYKVYANEYTCGRIYSSVLRIEEDKTKSAQISEHLE